VDSEDLYDLLRRLEEHARNDEDLAREFEASARRYFGGAGPSGDLAAAERHREFFLLERESERLGTTPILGLASILEGEEVELIEALCGSHTSLFEVLDAEARAAGLVSVEDLASGRRLDLLEARFGEAVEVGDLLVGRVFPVDSSSAFLSAAAARISDRSLVEAVKRDLGATRATRPRGGRLSQQELEELFFRTCSQPVRALEHVEAALSAFLEEADCELADAEALRAMATSAESAGAFLGPLLDELAFDTACDLETARRLALEYWQAVQALRTPAPSRSASPHPNSASAKATGSPSAAELADAAARASAVEAFERGRAEGKSLDALFRELESALGIEDDEDEDEDADAAWDVVGIGPILEEYAWDRERVGSPLEPDERLQMQAMAESWDRGTRRPDSVDALDEAMLRDYVLVDLPRWIRARGLQTVPKEAEGLERAWQHFHRFCAWLDEEHATELAPLAIALRERWLEETARCLSLTHDARRSPISAERGVWVRALGMPSDGRIEIHPLLSQRSSPQALGRSASGGPRSASSLGSAEVDLGEAASGVRGGDLLRIDLEGERLPSARALLCEVLPSGAEDCLRERQSPRRG
jgi:hypothetical protein